MNINVKMSNGDVFVIRKDLIIGWIALTNTTDLTLKNYLLETEHFRNSNEELFDYIQNNFDCEEIELLSHKKIEAENSLDYCIEEVYVD